MGKQLSENVWERNQMMCAAAPLTAAEATIRIVIDRQNGPEYHWASSTIQHKIAPHIQPVLCFGCPAVDDYFDVCVSCRFEIRGLVFDGN